MEKSDFEVAYNWLADAPLFIDADHVNRFHDAVVVPTSRIGPSTVQFGEEQMNKLAAEIKAEVEAGMPLIKVLKAKLSSKLSGELTETLSKTTSVIFEPIHTPQRQLVQIAWHYEAKYKERGVYVTDSSKADWRTPELISKVPRLLVFLDLPSQAEAAEKSLPAVKLIPTAGEFENGKIVQLYAQVRSKDEEEPPKYPERDSEGESVDELRKEYWAWFDKNFSATRAMILVEKAAAANGRIRWIDYRVPISTEGDTLHLHFVPEGKYDTGVFAYNLIKRGFKHGIRLVGTLKSEPDMNVLAVYDK